MACVHIIMHNKESREVLSVHIEMRLQETVYLNPDRKSPGWNLTCFHPISSRKLLSCEQHGNLLKPYILEQQERKHLFYETFNRLIDCSIRLEHCFVQASIIFEIWYWSYENVTRIMTSNVRDDNVIATIIWSNLQIIIDRNVL